MDFCISAYKFGTQKRTEFCDTHSLSATSPNSKGHYFLHFAKPCSLWNKRGICAAFHPAALLISALSDPHPCERSLRKARSPFN